MTKQTNTPRFIYDNVVGLFACILDDKRRAQALERPSLWLKLGIAICAFNAILIILMSPLPYMQSTIVIETIIIDGNELPVKTVSSSGPSNMYLALAGYLFNGSILFLVKKNVDEMSTVPTTIPTKRLDDSRIKDLTQRMAQRMKIAAPMVVVVDQAKEPSVESYVPSTDRASIVICKDVLEILSEEEIESVFAHEIFHIKSDVSHFVYRRTFKGEKMFWIFPFFLFFLIAIIQGPTLLLLFPLTVLDVYFPVAFELFWIMLALQFFGLILVALYALQSLKIPNMAVFYPDVFQYGADSFAALETGKTFALSTALMKIDFLRGGRKLDSQTAIASVKKFHTKESLSKLSKELRPSLFGKIKLDTRIRVLSLMHALLFGEVKFTFKRTLKVDKIQSEGFHLYNNPFEERVKTMKTQELATLMRHLSMAKQGLNLKKLEDMYGDPAQNLLALFLFLFTNGYIELTGISPIDK